ncbi:MAG: formate/nitrite transporter family protein [Actinobacteria bacterium]|nr:formate/nitrite transporter family protein [Actinomycetota bacterium]
MRRQTGSAARAGDPAIRHAFRQSVEDGVVRLNRSWPHLLATGFVGGVDLGLGVVAFFVVVDLTGSTALGALAFTIGFIALTLGGSELFTENFLVPFAAVVAHRARPHQILRLWAGTLVANLVGAWVIGLLVSVARPELAGTATRLAGEYPALGIGWEAFCLAVLGGAAITVMTWMERGSDTEIGRIVAAVGVAFLLVAAPLNHVVVSSAEMFAALHYGASFGYADMAGAAAWAVLGNAIGGLGLVTLMRFIQVGVGYVAESREHPDNVRRQPATGADPQDAAGQEEPVGP